MGKGLCGCCLCSVFRCLVINGDHSRAVFRCTLSNFESCVSVLLMLGAGPLSILLWKVVEFMSGEVSVCVCFFFFSSVCWLWDDVEDV